MRALAFFLIFILLNITSHICSSSFSSVPHSGSISSLKKRQSKSRLNTGRKKGNIVTLTDLINDKKTALKLRRDKIEALSIADKSRVFLHSSAEKLLQFLHLQQRSAILLGNIQRKKDRQGHEQLTYTVLSLLELPQTFSSSASTYFAFFSTLTNLGIEPLGLLVSGPSAFDNKDFTSFIDLVRLIRRDFKPILLSSSSIQDDKKLMEDGQEVVQKSVAIEGYILNGLGQELLERNITVSLPPSSPASSPASSSSTQVKLSSPVLEADKETDVTSCEWFLSPVPILSQSVELSKSKTKISEHISTSLSTSFNFFQLLSNFPSIPELQQGDEAHKRITLRLLQALHKILVRIEFSGSATDSILKSNLKLFQSCFFDINLLFYFFHLLRPDSFSTFLRILHNSLLHGLPRSQPPLQELLPEDITSLRSEISQIIYSLEEDL